jgi:hypothetical protein
VVLSFRALPAWRIIEMQEKLDLLERKARGANFREADNTGINEVNAEIDDFKEFCH